MMKETLKRIIKSVAVVGALVTLPIGVCISNTTLNEEAVTTETITTKENHFEENYERSMRYLETLEEDTTQQENSYIASLREYASSVVPNTEENKRLVQDMEIDVIEGELEEQYNVDYEEGENVLGFYNYEENYIVLETNDDDIYATLRHELGHSIDKYSDSEEWLNIFEEESVLLYADYDYPRSASEEYFAEAYSDYFSRREEMKELAPKTYKYIESVVVGNR